MEDSEIDENEKEKDTIDTPKDTNQAEKREKEYGIKKM